jgi:hypothetical protein
VLTDLGYEGERSALTIPIKITDAPLTDDQRTVNLLHAATRAPADAATPCSRHLRSAAPGQPLPLAHRRDDRRRPGPPPSRARPDDMITDLTQPLLGKAQ